MKTKLLLHTALFLLLSTNLFSQTDGWYLYTKTFTINKIVPEDVNTNELHLATDIGYIRYNTTTNQVTDFLNLTSQNPAIGHVNGLSLNPINNNIALALDNGFAIYDGSIVTIYNYTNSALTVGSVGGTQSTKLEVRYGRQGELYVFKPDITGYQIFNTGVFDVEVVTAIRPQDIIENQAGTKVFFAGSNNGLWELEKATTTFTNYTTSNSVLTTNVLLSLQVDASDVLYIGGFQGLNTMDSSGVWNTYQQLAPNSTAFLPVYEISVDETTGDLLTRNSRPSAASSFGLSTVNLTTNTWTNYTNDNTNCLNDNVFGSVAFGGNGKVYAAPRTFTSISDIGRVVEFTPTTETCSTVNINYMDAPVAVNSNVVTDFTLRKKSNGNLDIGFTRSRDFHQTEINPMIFNGNFSTPTSITPSPGNFIGSVVSDNDFFIIDSDTGWFFIDGNNNMSSFNHNIPDYRAITTQKAAVFDSNNGIITLVHKGFDIAFNYRVYKTQINTVTATGTGSEELFMIDRDFTQNIVFGTSEDRTTGNIAVVAVKTNASGTISRTVEQWDGITNNMSTVTWNEPHDVLPEFDPFVFFDNIIAELITAFAPNISTLQIRTENPNNGNPVITDADLNIIVNYTTGEVVTNNGGNNRILNHAKLIASLNENIKRLELSLIEANTNPFLESEGFKRNISAVVTEMESLDDFGIPVLKLTEIGDTRLDHKLPDDTSVEKFEILQYSPTEAIIVMLTNYGMLVKTGIDISGITLGTDDVSLTENNIQLYPNPATDMVSFLDDTINNIKVFDINGRKVLSIKNTNTFSVKNLSKGIYIVKAKNANNNTITKKLIKN